jgi:hypothetical protein
MSLSYGKTLKDKAASFCVNKHIELDCIVEQMKALYNELSSEDALLIGLAMRSVEKASEALNIAADKLYEDN